MVKKAALLLSSVFLLAACTGQPRSGMGTGSAYDGTFRGEPTGWCNVVPGNVVYGHVAGGVETQREIYKNGYITTIPCGNKARDIGGTITTIPQITQRNYNEKGEYTGSSAPVRGYDVQISPQWGTKIFPNNRPNRW
jgi:hypothetical protein